jgi:hypothetical protein
MVFRMEVDTPDLVVQIAVGDGVWKLGRDEGI